VPFRFKVRHAHLTRSANEAICVRISGRARDGRLVHGIGEALPREYVTGETAVDALDRCEELFGVLAMPVLREALNLDPGAGPDGVAGTGGVCDALIAGWRQASARGCLAIWSAIDVALIDWISRACNIRMRDLVAMIARRAGVQPCDASVPRRATIPMVRPGLASWLAAGYRIAGFNLFKIKVGDPASVARVRSVVRVLRVGGNRCDISFDANQGYSHEAAQKFLGDAMKVVPDMTRKLVAFEDPVRPSDPRNLGAFSGQTGVPVMADEVLHGEQSFVEMAVQSRIGVWNIRVGKCGGITGALMGCAAASRAGARIVIGAMVGQEAILDVASRHVESVAPVAWSENSFSGLLLRSSVFSREGLFWSRRRQGENCGTGFQLRESVLRRQLVGYRVVALTRDMAALNFSGETPNDQRTLPCPDGPEGSPGMTATRQVSRHQRANS